MCKRSVEANYTIYKCTFAIRINYEAILLWEKFGSSWLMLCISFKPKIIQDNALMTSNALFDWKRYDPDTVESRVSEIVPLV